MVSSEPIVMTGLINITQETSPAGAALQKSSRGFGSWDATASSSECIESLQSSRRGLRCRLSDASTSSLGQYFMIGLMNVEAARPQHPQQRLLRNSVEFKSISYAALISLGNFNVYEGGNRIGSFGTVDVGDVVEIRLTREDLPKIEYCVNGKVRHTSSEGPPRQARLFAKVCAYHQSPLVEDLQWILEKDPATQIAELQASITEQQTCIIEQPTRITELQTRISEQQADIEQLQAGSEQQKKEMKAGSDALLAVTKENAQLLVELEAAREASQAASETKAEIAALRTILEQQKKEMMAGSEDLLAVKKEKQELQMLLEAAREACRAAVEEKEQLLQHQRCLQEESNASRKATDEKVQLQEQFEDEKAASVAEKLELQAKVEALEAVVEQQKKEMKAQLQRESQENVKLQVRAMQLQAQNDALSAAMGELTEENARREVREMQLQVQEEQRRQFLQHSETSTEDWEQVGITG